MANMKITWLGQAGLLFENESVKIMIDPYLSDSCGKVNPKSHRRVPVDETFLSVQPDVLICTHNHMDHLDPETLPHFLTENAALTMLVPYNGWQDARKYGGSTNYVLFDRHTEWTQNGVRFTAVKAVHSDLTAVGVIIETGTERYYVSGDTLYSREILEDVTGHFNAIFLPVNGVGNNMNMEDAARLAAQIDTDAVVPLHIGLFDSKTADDFHCPNKVVPEFFKEIPLK